LAGRAAAASDSRVAQVARDALAHGNAVDAVVAGVLAAAAQGPSVLLGPVQILVAGGGAGLLAIDGRVRQPGRGAPRPRGAIPGSAVPSPARVGVPALPAALATVLAAAGSATLRRLVEPAVALARELSEERADVLTALARRGPPALVDEAILAELKAVAGRAAGGVFTRKDIDAVRPTLVQVEESSLEPAGWLRAPWRASDRGGSHVHVVAAADAQGRVCVACYESADAGVPIPALGLVAPPFASPVLRGKPRSLPGEPCPAPAPIAVRSRRGLADLAVGIAQAESADELLDLVLPRLDDSTLPAEVLSSTAGRPVAVVRTRSAAVVAASA
jgi:hypothetical protein